MSILNNKIKRNGIIIPILSLIFLILISAAVVFNNSRVMVKTLALQKQTEEIKDKLAFIIRGMVQRADVSVRGFAVEKDERLLKPILMAKENFEPTFNALEMQLKEQGFETSGLLKIKKDVAEYLAFSDAMIAEIRKDSLDQFRAMFREDRGTALWYSYDEQAKKINAFEDALDQEAREKYESAMNNNAIVQILLILFGIPTLVFIIIRLKKESANRTDLLKTLARSNKKYLFDDGIESSGEHKDEIEYVNESINNFRAATDFVSEITKGNLDTSWAGIDDQNKAFNQENLAGKLITLQEHLQALRIAEEQRNWVNEGLTRFTDIVRAHQNSIQQLTYEAIVFLTKYLNASQGGIFLLDTDTQVLRLSACYAYERKKHFQKEIPLGEGLIGQAFLEGETVKLTQIPQGYTTITSGLGEATPSCLLIVPLKYNEKTEAMIEIAGFSQWESYKIEFLERAGTLLASFLSNATTSQRMKDLLSESQLHTERLRNQEEELRQNIEELEASQEQLIRFSKENVN